MNILVGDVLLIGEPGALTLCDPRKSGPGWVQYDNSFSFIFTSDI